MIEKKIAKQRRLAAGLLGCKGDADSIASKRIAADAFVKQVAIAAEAKQLPVLLQKSSRPRSHNGANAVGRAKSRRHDVLDVTAAVGASQPQRIQISADAFAVTTGHTTGNTGKDADVPIRNTVKQRLNSFANDRQGPLNTDVYGIGRCP